MACRRFPALVAGFGFFALSVIFYPLVEGLTSISATTDPSVGSSPIGNQPRCPAAARASPHPGTPVSNVADEVIVIQGVFDPTGAQLLELGPVRRYCRRSGPLPDQPSGRFAVRATDVDGGETIVWFDALVADDSGREAHGFFEVTVPVYRDIVVLRITDASGVTEFARIAGSDIPTSD